MAGSIKEVLKELCETPGPSGFEEAVTEKAKNLLSTYMDETWIDTLGNAIGVKKCGKVNAPRLLIDAHIDENGFAVTAIEEGFLKFTAIGGLDNRFLPATPVKIMTQPPLDGVVCVLPPHILKTEDTKKMTKIEDMFIDVGLSPDEAKHLVPIGTTGVIESKLRDFGDNCVCGKALDNRAGFVSVLLALDELKDTPLDVDLYVMAGVQEEVGIRGAGAGAYAIAPDYAIIFDVSEAKTPDASDYETPNKLGEGVCIARGPNMNKKFTQKIETIAKEQNIDYQISVIAGGFSGTNTSAIQVSQSGVVTGLLLIPIKYVHSANEVVKIEDIESSAKLLSETIKSMKGGAE